MKNLILKLMDKISKFSFAFDRFTNKLCLKIRVKYAYVWNKKRIDKNYKKKIKEYWSKYKNINTNYHKMYSDVNGIKDVRYIPDYIYFYYITQYFNDVKSSTAIDDKNYYDTLLSDVKQPTTVIKNIDDVFYDEKFLMIDKEKAINIVKKELKVEKELLIKPTIATSGGKNVKVIKNGMNVEEILDTYKSNYIIQKLVMQSQELEKIHKESVNTIRTISLLYKGKVVILSSCLRMGIGDSRIDNASAGGITCGTKEDGTLRNRAFDKHGNIYDKHPTTDFNFDGYKIVGYDRIVEKIKELHPKFAHFKLISWDFAIDKNHEPIFIEFNLRAGELDFHQFNNGPIFGDLTDEILSDVFSKGENTK